MEQNKKALLTEQANKIAEVVKVLRTQFGEDFEDEVNYLEIVKKELEEVSANGRFSGTPIRLFKIDVLRRNKAWSPLERMTAKLLSLIPRSYRMPDSLRSVSCNFVRALTRSTSKIRFSTSSALRVCTAK